MVKILLLMSSFLLADGISVNIPCEKLREYNVVCQASQSNTEVKPNDPSSEIFFKLKKPYLGNVNDKPIHTGFTAKAGKDFTYELTLTTRNTIENVLEVSGWQDSSTARTYIGVYKKQILIGFGNTVKITGIFLKPSRTYRCRILYEDGLVSFYVNDKTIVNKVKPNLKGTFGEVLIGARNYKNNSVDRKVKSYTINSAIIYRGKLLNNDENKTVPVAHKITYQDKKLFDSVGRVTLKNLTIQYSKANTNGEIVFTIPPNGTYNLEAYNKHIRKWVKYKNPLKQNDENITFTMRNGEWEVVDENEINPNINLVTLSKFKSDIHTLNFKSISPTSFSLTPDPKEKKNRGASITLPTKVGATYLMTINVNKPIKVYFSKLLENGKYKSLRSPAIVSGVNKNVPLKPFKATGRKSYFYFAPTKEGNFIMKNISLKEIK